MILLQLISDSLQLPQDYILRIAKSASFSYKRIEIPKKNGGVRVIHHPSKELKAVQRWLLHAVISRLPIDDSALAYIKGRSIADNATRHLGGGYLLRLDLRNFFPSITQQDIKLHIKENSLEFPGWDDADVNLFCALVCRYQRLTIGAPSSPSLSNALCRNLDTEIRILVERNDINYTRYADDMFFSTSKPNVLGQIHGEITRIIENSPLPAGLMINSAKTRHTSKRHRRVVTGLVLSSENKLSVGRHTKRRVRSLIYNLGSLSDEDRHRLAGLISFIRSVEPDFVNRLILKYGSKRVILAQMPGKIMEI
jgi:RNA-directed DNA polymerase